MLPGQANSLAGIFDILGRLNIGDIVKAQVLEMTANELLLKLFDGTVLKASTLADIEAKPGETVEFLVKNKNEKQIFLETVKSNNDFKSSSLQQDLKKQLLSMDIPVNEQNMNIAKELKQSGLPVTRDTLDKVAEAIIKFKDLDISKAVFLSNTKIKIEKETIDSLKQLIDEKFRLGTQIDELFKLLSEADNDTINRIFEKTASIHGSGRTVKNAENLNSLKDMEDGTTIEFVNMKISKDHEVRSIFIKPELNEKITDFLKNGQTTIGNLREKAVEFLSSKVPGFEKLTTVQKKELTDYFSDIFLKLKNKNIPEESSRIQVSGPLEFDESNHKGALKKAFEDFYVKIDSKTLKSDLNVKENYREILNKLDGIRDILSVSSMPNRDEVINRIDNIQKSISFINDLNSYNTYIQIPLNIWGQNTTGELYVLKRDTRKKSIDPENAAVLLALDTQNLGRFEALVNISKKNISLNIRVEEQEVIDFLKDNYRHLYNSLSEKGYKLVDMKCRLIEEEVSILNANRLAKHEFEGNRISVDYRI